MDEGVGQVAGAQEDRIVGGGLVIGRGSGLADDGRGDSLNEGQIGWMNSVATAGRL